MGELDAGNAGSCHCLKMSLSENLIRHPHACVPSPPHPPPAPLTKSVCSSAASRLQDPSCFCLTGFPGLLSLRPGIHSQSLYWFPMENTPLPGFLSAFALQFTPLFCTAETHNCPMMTAPPRANEPGIFWGSQCFTLGLLFSHVSSFPSSLFVFFCPPISPLCFHPFNHCKTGLSFPFQR